MFPRSRSVEIGRGFLNGASAHHRWFTAAVVSYIIHDRLHQFLNSIAAEANRNELRCCVNKFRVPLKLTTTVFGADQPRRHWRHGTDPHLGGAHLGRRHMNFRLGPSSLAWLPAVVTPVSCGAADTGLAAVVGHTMLPLRRAWKQSLDESTPMPSGNCPR